MASPTADKSIERQAVPGQFPLGLCLAGIVTTSLGLAAAALDIRWGAAPPQGDALRTAWVNVNVMLMLTWLVLWPITAFRPPVVRISEPSPAGYLRVVLLRDFLSLAVAAIPALSVAAFLTGVSRSMIVQMAALQAAVGIFALGVIFHCKGRHPWEIAAMGVVLTLAVVAPVALYLWAEFFGSYGNGWYAIVPLAAAARAADGTLASSTLWGAGGIYAFFGIGLLSKTRTT